MARPVSRHMVITGGRCSLAMVVLALVQVAAVTRAEIASGACVLYHNFKVSSHIVVDVEMRTAVWRLR